MSALREIIAKFSFGFDSAPLERGDNVLTGFIGKIKQFAGPLAAGTAITAIAHMTLGLAEHAIQLERSAQGLRMSTEALEKWQGAAAIVGISAEEMNGVLKNIRPQMLERVADRIAKVTDPAKQARMAIWRFGDGLGQKLLPLLQKGKKGIDELKNEFEELSGGAMLDKDFIEQSKDLTRNVNKLKIAWEGIKKVVGIQVMPVMNDLVKHTVQLIKPFISVLKHSQFIKAALMALGMKGFLYLSRLIGPLGGALKMLASQFLKVIAPILILDDFLVFLKGGKSVIGSTIEKIFGAGSAEKVRQWFLNFKTAMFGSQADAEKWGGFFGGVVQTLGSLLKFLFNLITGGGDNFKEKTKALWDSYRIIAESVVVDVYYFFKEYAGKILDEFANMWNSVVKGGEKVADILPGILSKIPGLEGAANNVIDMNKEMAGKALATGGRGKDAQDEYWSEKGRLDAEMNYAIERMMGKPEVAPVINTTVHVPAGTPKDMADRVSKAAADSMTDGLRSFKNFLNQKGVSKPKGSPAT